MKAIGSLYYDKLKNSVRAYLHMSLNTFSSIIFVHTFVCTHIYFNNGEEYESEQFPVFFTELYLTEKPSFNIFKNKYKNIKKKATL